MPFQSSAQARKCFALRRRGENGSWDCLESAHATDYSKLPARKKQAQTVEDFRALEGPIENPPGYVEGWEPWFRRNVGRVRDTVNSPEFQDNVMAPGLGALAGAGLGYGAYRQIVGDNDEETALGRGLSATGGAALGAGATLLGQRALPVLASGLGQISQRLLPKLGAVVDRGGLADRSLANSLGYAGMFMPGLGANVLLAGRKGLVSPGVKGPDEEDPHRDATEEFSRVRPQELSDTVVRYGGTDFIDDYLWKKERGEELPWYEQVGGRLMQSRRTGPLGKLHGAVSAIPTTLLTNLLRASHYNPATDAVGQYIDDPTITEHELGHAIDFNETKPSDNWLTRQGQGTLRDLYTAAYGLPFVNLLHEAQANRESHKALTESVTDPDELFRREQARRATLPAGYGSYVGNAVGQAITLGTGAPVNFGGLSGLAAGKLYGLADAAYQERRRARDQEQGQPELKMANGMNPLALGSLNRLPSTFNVNSMVVPVKWLLEARNQDPRVLRVPGAPTPASVVKAAETFLARTDEALSPDQRFAEAFFRKLASAGIEPERYPDIVDGVRQQFGDKYADPLEKTAAPWRPNLRSMMPKLPNVPMPSVGGVAARAPLSLGGAYGGVELGNALGGDTGANIGAVAGGIAGLSLPGAARMRSAQRLGLSTPNVPAARVPAGAGRAIGNTLGQAAMGGAAGSGFDAGAEALGFDTHNVGGIAGAALAGGAPLARSMRSLPPSPALRTLARGTDTALDVADDPFKRLTRQPSAPTAIAGGASPPLSPSPAMTPAQRIGRGIGTAGAAGAVAGAPLAAAGFNAESGGVPSAAIQHWGEKAAPAVAQKALETVKADPQVKEMTDAAQKALNMGESFETVADSLGQFINQFTKPMGIDLMAYDPFERLMLILGGGMMLGSIPTGLGFGPGAGAGMGALGMAPLLYGLMSQGGRNQPATPPPTAEAMTV